MRARRRPFGRTARVEYTLPRHLASPRWARQLTTDFLSSPGTPPGAARKMDETVLVVSELVTNAVRHGHSRCRLRVSTERRRVVVEVVDTSRELPTTLPHGPYEESGRGLTLVRHLTHRFRITPHPQGGKTVRAVLHAE